MAKIQWDSVGERRYEIGVDRGVFYTLVGDRYMDGVPWNGLTGVDDDAEGRERTVLYSNGVKTGSEYTLEEYSAAIRCYTYPDEFEPYLGVSEIFQGIYVRQQPRKIFGFCYRSRIGNDTDGMDYGYKLHLVYNLRVTDFGRAYKSLDDSSSIDDVEIRVETFPVDIGGDYFEYDYDPVSEITIDSRSISSEALEKIENVLYGVNGKARMPFPNELIDLITPEVIMDEEYPFPFRRLYPAEDLYPNDPSEYLVPAEDLYPADDSYPIYSWI